MGVLVLVAILVVIFRIRALKPKQNQTKQPPPDLNQVDLTLHYLASKYANDRLSSFDFYSFFPLDLPVLLEHF